MRTTFSHMRMSFLSWHMSAREAQGTYANGNEQIIREGDYFVIDYGSTHSYHALSDEFEIINCLFLPELIDVSLKHCKSLQTVIDNYQIQFRSEYFSVSPSSNTFKDDDGCIVKLLRDMMNEFQSGLPGYGQLIRARMIEILILTMRKIYINPAAGSHDDTMNAVISYIGKNYASDLTLGDICKKFGYSLPYMSLKFKQNFKMTYTAFCRRSGLNRQCACWRTQAIPLRKLQAPSGTGI